MPIYEYMCDKCGHTFDQLQKINEAPITLCPVCANNTARRLISAAAFQLKGTGWYATDFKNNDKTKKPVASDTATKTENAPASENATTSTKNTTTGESSDK